MKIRETYSHFRAPDIPNRLKLPLSKDRMGLVLENDRSLNLLQRIVSLNELLMARKAYFGSFEVVVFLYKPNQCLAAAIYK